MLLRAKPFSVRCCNCALQLQICWLLSVGNVAWQCLLTTADLPVIQQILNKTSLLEIQQLRPAVAYVLVYELLFGQVHFVTRLKHTVATDMLCQQTLHWLQGCRIKGKAEKAVFSLKVG